MRRRLHYSPPFFPSAADAALSRFSIATKLIFLFLSFVFVLFSGPATVRMVSTGSPPVPLPVQVPPGHVLQQIVDERGTLRHVILSPAPATAAGPTGQPPPSSSAAAAAAASSPVGVLPLPTPSHPPPPPPPHYVSIDWVLLLGSSHCISLSLFLSPWLPLFFTGSMTQCPSHLAK